MTPPAGAAVEAPIRAYLDQVAAGLHGPRRQRARILAELRDGLTEAIAARGEPGAQAAAGAIAQFGPPEAVAAAFAGELATGFARRTLITYVATGPLVGIWWLLLLRPDPWHTGLAALLAAIPVLPLVGVAVVTAAGTLATTGRLMRRLPEASPRRALVATLAVAGLTAAGDLLIIGVAARSGALAGPLAGLAVAAGLARLGYGGRTLTQAAALLRRLTRAAAAGFS